MTLYLNEYILYNKCTLYGMLDIIYSYIGIQPGI